MFVRSASAFLRSEMSCSMANEKKPVSNSLEDRLKTRRKSNSVFTLFGNPATRMGFVALRPGIASSLLVSESHFITLLQIESFIHKMHKNGLSSQ